MNEYKQKIESMISNKIQAGKQKLGPEFEMRVLEILALEKMIEPQKEQKEREIPLTQWSDFHPDPSINALRMLVFRAKENGFDKVITRRGKRILIKEDTYFRWREEQEQKKSKHRG